MRNNLWLWLLCISSSLLADFGLPPKIHPKYQVAICALFQNEGRFLREWIEYHLLIGVDHFYLFDNLSTDHFRTVLEPYIAEGIVELFDWPYQEATVNDWVCNVQCTCYNKILQERAFEAAWIACIDIDEFIVMTEQTDLKEFLLDYQHYAGLCINWQLFGTSNIQRIPDNVCLIKMLTQKAPTYWPNNEHVKSIVRPFCVKGYVNSSHFCKYRGKLYAVNEEKKPVNDGRFFISVNKIRLNHYILRDLDFFYKEKVNRAARWGFPSLQINKELNQVEDRVIFRFLPDLEKRLQSR